MEHAFSRITAIFTAILMFFLVPLIMNLQRQESLIQLVVMQDTVQFVDSVRNMGGMTADMYYEYQNKICRMQNGLEIHMIHTANSLHTGEHGIEQTQKIHTENEIIGFLETDNNYLFQKNDYFRIEVVKKLPGLLERFYHALNMHPADSEVYVYYGGSIRYEVR